MNEFVLMFINQYGAEILATILTAVLSAVGTWVGKIYKKKVNTQIKRDVVKTCCTAVEQLYKDFKGEDKFSIACKYIEQMLAEQKITITHLELEMLIEEVCHSFAHAVKEEVEKVEAPVTGFVTEESDAE